MKVVPVQRKQNSLGIGLSYAPGSNEYEELVNYTNLKLATLGLPTVGDQSKNPALKLSGSLVKEYREKVRLLRGYLCPADRRIQDFLSRILGADRPSLPTESFVLDRHGLARTTSLPRDGNIFASKIIESKRVAQGVLHNPSSDRRTTAGVFHVADVGLPAADDKKVVPLAAAKELLRIALNPPQDDMIFPFSYGQEDPAKCWVSLLLRPVVCPEVQGYIREKSMEVRFFAPGGCVANLDFVESIFGNAGDPFLAENDAGLDIENWTGHTGCVIVAPHLAGTPKQVLNLPPKDQATERQIRDGMYYEDPDELYNDGNAFKLTFRDSSGMVVTVLADNYFGYCKKEVKTQVSFSANLSGLGEEEHAGGAVVFPSYDLGEEFDPKAILPPTPHTFKDTLMALNASEEASSEGYLIDEEFPSVVFLPENATFSLREQRITWEFKGEQKSLHLIPDNAYVLPSGYKVEMKVTENDGPWKLVGTVGEGFLCHKPCTVSGGGKSEISKPLTDAIVSGPVYVAEWEKDLALAKEVIDRDYSDRFLDPKKHNLRNRTILDPDRSLGSVIKLLTPSHTLYTDTFNDWLESIPQRVKDLVLIIKRRYRPDWGLDWEKLFSVDSVNGQPANELRFDGDKLITRLLRVGFDEKGSWRLFALRKDFIPASKILAEDDITASTVAPIRLLNEIGPGTFKESAKFVHNCEYRLFQRPDDAIHRGFDKQTEKDLARPGNFISNFECLSVEDAKDQVRQTLTFEKYTDPMRDLILEVSEQEDPDNFFVSSANPRMVDGKPTKNPRYLQTRPDLYYPRTVHLATMGTRLRRKLSPDQSVLYPVRSVLPGRRNNPADPDVGIRPLCCFAPIHYLELPELFIDFIVSVTGKSPSTTGAGSEGALTKAPFNALLPIHDLNAALISYAATGQGAFVTSAGFIGPKYQVAHDVSLLIPEIWSRLRDYENDPQDMIANGLLEKVPQMDFEGETLPTQYLGYRITRRFAHEFLGRIFTDPISIFPEDMLKPELQDEEQYADSLRNLVETGKSVAKRYFQDGSIEKACPPLRALLELMSEGSGDGKSLQDKEFRKLFDPEAILSSDWYEERLKTRISVTRSYWEQRISYLEKFLEDHANREASKRLDIPDKLDFSKDALSRLTDDKEAIARIHGCLGTDPSLFSQNEA
ncbi:MAG: hypothetical protein VX839_02375 [Verrucomicrobiota bacterium]|nr:hypothetical protein [Verrucomicrobiota bacterium]